MDEPSVIWTVGHSTRTSAEFLSLLRENKIALVADVRQFPGSRRYPQFGKARLASRLKRTGIEYRHFPDLGGHRRPLPGSRNTAWRKDAFRGYADYMETDAFKAGIGRLAGAASRMRTAVMCAEAVWWRCHRALISDYFKAAGYRVLHIMGPHQTREHPFSSAARIIDSKLSYAGTS